MKTSAEDVFWHALSRWLNKHSFVITTILFGVMCIAAFLASHTTFSLLNSSDFYPQDQQNIWEEMAPLLNRFEAIDGLVIDISGEKRLDINQVEPFIEALVHTLGQTDLVKHVRYRVPESIRSFIQRDLPSLFLLYLSPDEIRAYGEFLDRANMRKMLERAEHMDRKDFREWIPGVKYLQRKDPLRISRLAGRHIASLYGKHNLLLRKGYFGSRDGTHIFIIVEPAEPPRQSHAAKAFSTIVDQAIDDTLGHPEFEDIATLISVSAIGRAKVFSSSFDTLVFDAKHAVAGSLGIALVILALFFRRMTSAIIVTLPVIIALVITTALASLVYESINLISLLFAAVLIGIGIDFAIHVGAHYWLFNKAEKGDIPHAIGAALARPGRGIIFAALTSAAVFLALLASDYTGLAQMAMLTATGILISLVCSITLLPLLLSRMSPGNAPPMLLHWVTSQFERASRRWPRTGILLWAGAVGIATVGMFDIQYESHPWSVAVRGNPHAEQLIQLNETLGVSWTPILIASEGETMEEAIERDREVNTLLAGLDQPGHIAYVQSLSRYLPSAQEQQENLTFMHTQGDRFSASRFVKDWEQLIPQFPKTQATLFPNYKDLVATTLEVKNLSTPITIQDLQARGLDGLVERHLANIDDHYVAVTYVYLSKFPWVGGAVLDFLEQFERAGGTALKTTTILGESMRAVGHSRELKREVVKLSVIALSLLIIILAVQFRRPRHMLMALMPLLAAVWITVGIMGFLGIQLSFITLAVIPILLGIGIDDGIHIVERSRSGDDVETILRETGAAMTVTTATTLGAFVTLMFAHLQAIHEFATVTAIGVGICLLASLHLLPCFLRLQTGRPISPS